MITAPNLILTSSFQTVANDLREKNVIPPAGASVAFIPTAGDVYVERPWQDRERQSLVDLGYRVVNVGLADKTAGILRGELAEFDVLFVAGGNVTFLAEHARRSGFSMVVRELLAKGVVYVGSSAGSMIVGPSVLPFYDEERHELPSGFVVVDGSCMGLVDYVVLPHDNECAEGNDATEKRYAGAYRFVRLTDAEYRCETVRPENVVLLHGIFPERFDGILIADIPLCDPNNPGNWMGWTKQELLKRGYDADCPVIVDVWNASWEQWKRELDRLTIDEGTTLVGWSAGGYALLRYIGETGKSVKRVILVAPGAPENIREDLITFPHMDDFYSFEIAPKLKSQIRDRVDILVSDDFDFILRAVDFYERTLGANVTRLKDRGHFSFLIPTLPELLEKILAD